MAILKKKQLMQMSSKEMSEKLSELRLELSRERASSEIGILKSPGKARNTKKEIARILTIISQKGGLS